ncbi:hypothetical protein EYF80_014247 [Liparis tanakae]|uniref:Uncharacterized protein n=1 Tax=Liparis tanakae TaxID=230148 RepID=A0A4Z2ID48_9TELE|nr:hypothetical protein EYF80_014247 [Liparis tanakae]
MNRKKDTWKQGEGKDSARWRALDGVRPPAVQSVWSAGRIRGSNPNEDVSEDSNTGGIHGVDVSDGDPAFGLETHFDKKTTAVWLIQLLYWEGGERGAGETLQQQQQPPKKRNARYLQNTPAMHARCERVPKMFAVLDLERTVRRVDHPQGDPVRLHHSTRPC